MILDIGRYCSRQFGLLGVARVARGRSGLLGGSLGMAWDGAREIPADRASANSRYDPFISYRDRYDFLFRFPVNSPPETQLGFSAFARYLQLSSSGVSFSERRADADLYIYK